MCEAYRYCTRLIAERHLLGALLLETQCFARLGKQIKPEMLCLAEHRALLQIMERLNKAGWNAHVHSVTFVLNREQSLGSVGGYAYLNALAGETPGRSCIDGCLDRLSGNVCAAHAMEGSTP